MAQALDAQLAPPAPAAKATGTTVFVDPATHHQRRDGLFDRESNPYAGDSILAPYTALRDRFAAAGMSVHTADLLADRPDDQKKILISFGTPDRLVAHSVRRYEALARRPDVVMSAFVAMECPIVEPTMFEALPALRKVFRRILSWSDTESLLPFTKEPVPVEHFCWPQSFDRVHEDLWSRCDRKFLLMMNANKLPRLYVNELYTARLRAVEFFHRYGEIDLYGRNWDRMPARVGKVRTPATFGRIVRELWQVKQRYWPDPLYATMAAATKGPARSKSKTVAQYRFALCFENSILKGWLTEKIFDCFFSGTVPVYWGAPDVLDWIPAECFIDMRRFKDFTELRAFLHSLTPAAERRYREAAREFVGSARFKPFRLDTFADVFARIVSADTGVAV